MLSTSRVVLTLHLLSDYSILKAKKLKLCTDNTQSHKKKSDNIF